jgi:hypothetical protein
VLVCTDPGNVTWMTPAQAQIQVDPLTSAGLPPISFVGANGTQAWVTGIQGIGVNTPSAAAVAAMTVGLDGLLHIPKGGMFTIGAASWMVAAGRFSMFTRPIGSTFSVLGAAPKEQESIAPATTFSGM